MVKAAWRDLVAWWEAKGRDGARAWCAKLGGWAVEWWSDIGDKPRSHFLSMMLILIVQFIVKLAVR